MGKITFSTAKTRDDIAAIIQLQRQNQRKNLDEATIQREGFVSFEYQVEPLFRMNGAHPSAVAWSETGELAGYCISAASTDRGHFAQLDNMLAYFDGLEFCGKKLAGLPVMYCGQICVAEGFRGQGVFDGLYQKFRELWSAGFEFCLTEISAKNPRSLRAHERVGFRVFHQYVDPVSGENWDAVGWDWRSGGQKINR